jgi:dUTP pyrophosphatase
MKLIYQQTQIGIDNKIHAPEYAHANDSGMDIYSPTEVILKPGARVTVNLEVKFKIQSPLLFKLLNYFGVGLGVELHVRPKSGRSKSGVEISLGTIDEGYRNSCGATIHNFSNEKVVIKMNEKLCQIVAVPVFNKTSLIYGAVDAGTERGLGGFGSTSLHKK